MKFEEFESLCEPLRKYINDDDRPTVLVMAVNRETGDAYCTILGKHSTIRALLQHVYGRLPVKERAAFLFNCLRRDFALTAAVLETLTDDALQSSVKAMQ